MHLEENILAKIVTNTTILAKNMVANSSDIDYVGGILKMTALLVDDNVNDHYSHVHAKHTTKTLGVVVGVFRQNSGSLRGAKRCQIPSESPYML